MSQDISQKPLTIANSSGFPLQIAVANLIDKSDSWVVLFEEHPWRSEVSGSEGFIDIVAIQRSDIVRMVIECKRVRQTGWVFLVPNASPSSRRLLTIFDVHKQDGKIQHYDWANWRANPDTFQSEYCAIPGQEQGRKNLIERTAANLVASIEAIAAQEKDAGLLMSYGRLYIPVIVTTARLFVCFFDPAVVDLKEGNLPDDIKYTEVPFVRYRKSLVFVHSIEKNTVDSLRELHDETMRSIVVVNASRFSEFLEVFEIQE